MGALDLSLGPTPWSQIERILQVARYNADPDKDATLIVGSGTDSDPGPIVVEIGLDTMGVPVPMRVLWHAGAESPLSVVEALWADPQMPERLFVGGFTKKAGDPPLIVVQAGKLHESVKFHGQQNYELRALGELEAARPDHEGVSVAGVNVGGEVRLYLVRARQGPLTSTRA